MESRAPSVWPEIYFDFLPPGMERLARYVESGIWEITLKAAETVDGRYDLWLPSGGVLNRSTRFLRPAPETTLTIPSTAMRPVSVGAYDDTSMTYAPFSGREIRDSTGSRSRIWQRREWGSSLPVPEAAMLL